MVRIFQRAKCRFALGTHFVNAATQHTHLYIFANFNLNLIVINNLCHLANQAAVRDNRITLRNFRQRFLLLLGFLLLRADQQEVKHTHDQYQRHDHADKVASTGCRSLSNKHIRRLQPDHAGEQVKNLR
jgi:hypothetical protein